MKIKVIIVLLLLGFLWFTYAADQRKRAIAVCIERGVGHFKDIGQFPYVKEGVVKYLAIDIATARCSKNAAAFKSSAF